MDIKGKQYEKKDGDGSLYRQKESKDKTVKHCAV